MYPSLTETSLIGAHSGSNSKLVYLQHSLKDGSAKSVIEGLSRSGEYYAEAVKCLKSRYDQPRLIHQTHVRMVVEAPSLKDGSGRELRHLHDTVQQHLRALRAMDSEPSGPFITSLLELKLDANTTFEWRKHSQESIEVPHYSELLEFINLRAQASDTSVRSSPRNDQRSTRKPPVQGKPVAAASFTANTSDSGNNNCVLCKNVKHPLYVCSRFKCLPHDEMVSTLKSNGLCLNCLKPGHFIKQCKSIHRCQKCQKPHHTLLHIESRVNTNAPSSTPARPNSGASDSLTVSTNAAAMLKSNSLLMTCRVLVDAPDGSTVEVRALLDSASSASFVSERLTQSLCLTRSHQNAKISGIAGLSHASPLQSIASFQPEHIPRNLR